MSKLIAFGHIEREFCQPGSQLVLPWAIAGTDAHIDISARVAKLPFLELRRS